MGRSSDDFHMQRVQKHLRPIIEEKIRMKMDLGTDYDESKSNDLISWVIDAGEEKEVPDLVRRVLVVNFAAIHTTSLSFTHALYQLAANPEYVDSLRAEVDSVLKEDGWTKEAMQRLVRVDSFLKETQRLYGIASAVLSRRATKDFTFSDGTYIPKGAFISTASTAAHRDDEYYDKGRIFKPWRFSDMSDGQTPSDEGAPRNSMATTSKDYLAF